MPNIFYPDLQAGNLQHFHREIGTKLSGFWCRFVADSYADCKKKNQWVKKPQLQILLQIHNRQQNPQQCTSLWILPS